MDVAAITYLQDQNCPSEPFLLSLRLLPSEITRQHVEKAVRDYIDEYAEGGEKITAKFKWGSDWGDLDVQFEVEETVDGEVFTSSTHDQLGDLLAVGLPAWTRKTLGLED